MYTYSLNKILILISSCFLIILQSLPTSAASTKVIGYIPMWENIVNTTNRTDLSNLTHLNLAFANPDSQGRFLNNNTPTCMSGSNADINYVVERAHQANVKVLISVAGGVIPECSGDWQTLLQPENRAQLIQQVLDFMAFYQLDGIDIDLEGVLLTSIHTSGNYVPFIRELKEQLAEGALLTAATASYEGGMIPTESLAYFDFVNIMSYDAIGPTWGQAGTEHATLDFAVENINTWKSRGLEKDKLVLGLPFYGYGFGQYQSDYNYSSLMTEFGEQVKDTDIIGSLCDGCSYITFNSEKTIRSKTQLALKEGSGVMIWELSQDIAGENNLLNAIQEEINGETSQPTTDTSTPTTTPSSSNSGGGSLPPAFILVCILAAFIQKYIQSNSKNKHQ
ncbi:glycosyl hydrolase family 18 protein [Teredinibacter sp. KSP-S5-2]|uniref:glycosyl hydrolase family 18 protein n=1 Tax=Teredinibacter sp. KSP-S5-2 TaxID=3034506 RepID=UPI002934B30D|nr:glycosyl hydrolase family 18 protein [Teredinibacter sp. KSP-S5-2]WNO08421.1 glycosyl hydrolase family 18 protein [Teredinibacter sp. KSP-S5-2]